MKQKIRDILYGLSGFAELILIIFSLIIGNWVMFIITLSLFAVSFGLLAFMEYHRCPYCGKFHGLELVEEDDEPLETEQEIRENKKMDVAPSVTPNGFGFAFVRKKDNRTINFECKNRLRTYKCMNCNHSIYKTNKIKIVK